MGGRPCHLPAASQAIVQQAAAQLDERLLRLRQCNSSFILCLSKPAGLLSQDVLSRGGCFLSTPAGPLSKGMLSHGGYFLSLWCDTVTCGRHSPRFKEQLGRRDARPGAVTRFDHGS
jgi:hypothetical protein